MGEYLVAFLPVRDCLANRGYDPGRRDAKRHRRYAADIPLARANELVPVGDPRGPHLDQDLIAGQRARIGEVDRLDGTGQLLDPGGEHSQTSLSVIWPCRTGARQSTSDDFADASVVLAGVSVLSSRRSTRPARRWLPSANGPDRSYLRRDLDLQRRDRHPGEK